MDQQHACEGRAANPLFSRSMGLFVVLQRTHAFSPIHLSSTRTREHAFPPAILCVSYKTFFAVFFFNSNSSPLQKVSKGTNEISYLLHEERERQRKERKGKETKGRKTGKQEKSTHRPLPTPTLFRLSPDFLWHPRSESWRQCMKKWIERFLDFRVQ